MSSTSIIGLDLGGTKIHAGRYDAQTVELIAEEKIATDAEAGFSKVLQDCIDLINRLRTDDTTAVGIGIPGLIHQPEGVVIRTPNIPHSENFAVKKECEKQLKLPVTVENDARCFALAEAIMGAGKGKRVVIGMTIGTGVGGGIVIDEKVFHGSHGFAGEIGHMLLMPGSPPYETDDNRGDIEQFISGTAMGKRCTAAKRPEDYMQGEVCAFLQPQVFREVAQVIASLTYMLDPDIVVLGGSAGKSLKPHLSKITEELKQWTMAGTPLPEIAVTALSHPGAMGAALVTL